MVATVKTVSAVNGVLATVTALAWFSGGRSVFGNFDPSPYLHTLASGQCCSIFKEDLERLMEAYAASRNLAIKSLSEHSLKVYLSHLRNGKRPNSDKLIPSVNLTYSMEYRLITICSQDFSEDFRSLEFRNFPMWIYSGD